MALGTLFASYRIRCTLSQALVKYFKFDIDIIDIDATKSELYLKEFPLHKTPTYIASDGQKLQEVNPLNIYFTSLIKDQQVRKQLTSEDKPFEKALQGKWLSLTNSDLLMNANNVFYVAAGRWEFHKDLNNRSWDEVHNSAKVFEERLKDNKYLVNEQITLADLYCSTIWAFIFNKVAGKEFSKQYPSIEPWVREIIVSPILKGWFDDFEVRERNVDEK